MNPLTDEEFSSVKEEVIEYFFSLKADPSFNGDIDSLMRQRINLSIRNIGRELSPVELERAGFYLAHEIMERIIDKFDIPKELVPLIVKKIIESWKDPT